MPFARPTLSEIRARVASNISSRLPGADAQLRFSNLSVIGDVQAGSEHLQYGYLDWIAKQAVPGTATGEYLEMWAALKKVTRKGAAAASGSVSFVASNGKSIPEGTPVTRSDGVAYTVTTGGTESGGSIAVTVTAVDPGAAGNAAAGVQMNLGVSIAYVTSSGATSGPLTGGADVETDDELRSRMLQAYASPPQGGAAADYVTWARQVPGVTRAWVTPNGMGIGSVVVFVMLDDAEAADGGFPQGANGVATNETRVTGSKATGDQLVVANYIFTLRPVTALVWVQAPQANTVDFTIAGLGASPPASLQSAIAAAIAGVFLAEGSVGGATLPDGTTGGTIDMSLVESAIGALAAAQGFVITAASCSAGSAVPGPAGNITSNAGYLPVPGTVTYTA